MIHLQCEIAHQVLFSIDVATTTSMLADKLKSIENTIRHVKHTNMQLLFPGTYPLGLMHSSADEDRAPSKLARTILFPAYHLLANGTMLHSVQ